MGSFTKYRRLRAQHTELFKTVERKGNVWRLALIKNHNKSKRWYPAENICKTGQPDFRRDQSFDKTITQDMGDLFRKEQVVDRNEHGIRGARRKNGQCLRN